MDVSVGWWWWVGGMDACIGRQVVVRWMNGWICRYVNDGWTDVSVGGR